MTKYIASPGGKVHMWTRHYGFDITHCGLYPNEAWLHLKEPKIKSLCKTCIRICGVKSPLDLALGVSK